MDDAAPAFAFGRPANKDGAVNCTSTGGGNRASAVGKVTAMPTTPPHVLLIGASTGGPRALNDLIAEIGGVLQRAPVLITQHMPATFTAVLAEHLARIANCPVREAVDGEQVNAGVIYLAPGGKHMKVTRRDGAAVILIEDGPMVNFCKPAVDPMFSSAAEVWGNKVLALVLTGMGSDGSPVPSPSLRPAAMCWRRTKRPVWSGACRGRSPMRAYALQ